VTPSFRASGEQFELSSGDQRAVVVEVGGGLRSYASAGRECLDGYATDVVCPSGRGQILAPWPNRLEDGSYEFDGRTLQVPLSEPAAHNAIHGLVRWAAWTARERERHRVVMEHRLHPQPGYPFALDLTVEYSLSEVGLTVRATALNAGRDACPFGFGMHPYLTLGASVDRLSLHAPARTVLVADERGIPRGALAVDGGEYDFRAGRPIGTTRLDHCLTDFERAEDGHGRVHLVDPTSGSELVVWFDESFPYVMVFTGDALPDVARRALAVEPMTCPPNSFRSGKALLRLEPGDRFTGSWGITPRDRHSVGSDPMRTSP
jgi:aldose 1-epimerase